MKGTQESKQLIKIHIRRILMIFNLLRNAKI